MRLKVVGEFPDSYLERIEAQFGDVVLASDGPLDAVLAWGRPLEQVIEAARRQPDLAWIHTRAAGVSPAFLDGLDILVIAAPLTASTDGLIGATELARLQRGALLVNVGRGQIVNQAAMLEALESGQLGGAALDVFEAEPLPADSPLWRMPNVIVSPHCADSTPQSPERSLAIFLDNLGRFR